MTKRTRPTACCPLARVRPLAKGRSRELTDMLAALADPTRLEILRLVAAQSGPVCACDIVDRFDLSQPTISHHLRVLRDAGLLTSRRSGLWSFYETDPAGLARLAELPSIFAA